MIDRACISINNRCNLNCTYCHFHTTEKAEYLAEAEMNVYTILDNIRQHIDKYDIEVFKLGFVGNGEIRSCTSIHSHAIFIYATVTRPL